MTKAKAKQDPAPAAVPEDRALVTEEGMAYGGIGALDEAAFLGKLQSVEEAEHGDATADEVRDDMGSATPELDRIEVKHQGVNQFHFADGSKVDGEDGLSGAVLAFTFHNSWFSKAFEEHQQGERPPCYSHDGTNVAAGAEDPQSMGGCASCPRNRDARDPNARKEAFDQERHGACANYLSLAIVLPGRQLPYHLRLSNRSFKNWSKYVQTLYTRKRFRHYQVGTKVTLRNVEKGAQQYSVAEFTMLGVLDEGLQAAFKVESVNCKAILQRAADDLAPTDEGASAAAEARAEAQAEAEKAPEAAL
jgi:hypothetical protein